MAPQRPIGYWLRLVDRLINEQFDQMLETHGVTRRQWQLLNLLGRRSATEAELAQELAPFLDETASQPLAEELAELVESGWVSQAEDVYAMTERGQTSVSRLGEVVGDLRTGLAQGVSAEEYAQTLDVLQRMARNLGWTESSPEA